MTDSDTGLNMWQKSSNHNSMMERQHRSSPLASEKSVELAYFGSSAFRITTPEGITIMLDPWRNHPVGKWDWYFRDFPEVAVDIGVSTHAHFDHDALHRLDAHVLLDRLIGQYEFRDVKITGIADKHATDSTAANYDFKNLILQMDGIDITPPNNPRSWDNCLVIVETGGWRILHWGDNRHNPPEHVWEALGTIDLLLVPADNSQHVLSHENVDAIIERLNPRIVVPHHYYIWEVVQRQSTLMPANDWLDRHTSRVENTADAFFQLPVPDGNSRDPDHQTKVVNFGENVAFDTVKWRANS